MSQVEVTSNSTSLVGRDNLQEKLKSCEKSLKGLSDALLLIQHKSSLADDMEQFCNEVSNWLQEAEQMLKKCETPWNSESELETKLSDLEVGCCYGAILVAKVSCLLLWCHVCYYVNVAIIVKHILY